MAKVHSPMIRRFAIATNTVTVNSQTAWRKGEYFWAQVKSNNTAAALWEDISVVSGGTTNKGNLFVPKTPEQFSYDADGNLTNDGRWCYVWDAENRLIQMTVNTNVGPQYQLTFAYDAKSRRIQKTVFTNGVGLYTNRFVYDGWNLIAEVGTSGSLVRGYVWGTDLSGSSQGAGGVGGLLWLNAYASPSSYTSHFAAYDGNGNVSALVSATDGTETARYEYGPFGEAIRITGTVGKLNPIRFSTQYADDVRNVVKYLYREYVPSTGTWPSRDPLEEVGGDNLYAMSNNDLNSNIDMLGLRSAKSIQCIVGARQDGQIGPKTAELIKQYQSLLIQAGCLEGGADGKWGPKTEAAHLKCKGKSPLEVPGRISFYCACTKCCGPNASGICADGSRFSEGVLAAPMAIPMGSTVTFTLDGKESSHVVHDRGGAIKVTADFCKIDYGMEDHDKCIKRGVLQIPIKISMDHRECDDK